MREQRCETCRFYVNDHAPDGVRSHTLKDVDGFNHEPTGECRRYPPVSEARKPCPERDSRQFPSVWTDDWCGEWQGRAPVNGIDFIDWDIRGLTVNALSEALDCYGLKGLAKGVVAHAAIQGGVRTLRELAGVSESEWRERRNCGKIAAGVIVEWFKRTGEHDRM